jgi:SIR2-like domain
MTIDLPLILPNISHTLDGTGFLFGAGTSLEAGYPMMPQLTREVMSAINSSERAVLDEVLTHAGETYKDASATPNIEQLSDLVIAHWTNSGDVRFSSLENRLRELILDRILSVTAPNIDNHCRFFESLKRRAFGLPCSVWIFTTNYDLLFETAAAKVGVMVENGFSGTVDRYFNPTQFKNVSGSVASGRFTPGNALTVKLVKLHGSISWTEEASKFYERHPAALSPGTRRVMVLPRRKKVMDTMTPPYDTLFSQANKALGSECKYIVSCGFSFADEHINQQLLLPVLQANRCRLFALSQEETVGFAAFKPLPNFSAGFESHCHSGGRTDPSSTDTWKFSKFVTLFE